MTRINVSGGPPTPDKITFNQRHDHKASLTGVRRVAGEAVSIAARRYITRRQSQCLETAVKLDAHEEGDEEG